MVPREFDGSGEDVYQPRALSLRAGTQLAFHHDFSARHEFKVTLKDIDKAANQKPPPRSEPARESEATPLLKSAICPKLIRASERDDDTLEACRTNAVTIGLD